jgi:hypothetical protein
MRWLKLSQVSKGLAIAFLILVFLEIPLLAAFREGAMIQIVNKTRPATETEITLGLLLFAAVAIVGAEAARPWIRQALSLDESKLSVQWDSLASTLDNPSLVVSNSWSISATETSQKLGGN